MIKTNNKGLLIVVSGPSGAGKDTICQKLIKENSNIWMSVSMTTRKPRPLEKDGVDYFFVSKEDFFNKINDNISFNDFYLKNESLITNEEILNIRDNIINKYPTLISKILNSDSIKVVLSKPKNITCEYIICSDKNNQNLFLEISDKLID